MLPPDRVLAGSLRWLDLLHRNTLRQTWTIFDHDPRYGDLTRTQYHSALDWLASAGLVARTDGAAQLTDSVRNLTSVEAAVAVLARALELDPPAWLADADALVADPRDLPQDVGRLAEALNLHGAGALEAIRRAQRKVDLEARARIGAAGETGLIQLLETHWPDSTTHVAADDDTAGYDIAFVLDCMTWHIEVKATNRRGRLVIYLSRHEYETSLSDPAWRLVVVGLDEQGQLAALATVRCDLLHDRSPTDTHGATKWSSARYELEHDELEAGLSLGTLDSLTVESATTFAWMPAHRKNEG